MIRYHISEKAMFQEVKNESVILGLESGEYFTLDEIGTRMLQLFQIEPDTHKVATKITQEYAVAFEQAHTDLIALLNKMVSHGLATKDEA
ncbi:MAG: PqqD family protein [Candidatus Polarisedimenticolaceae bacterium]|nr:PqqD family protein [Candidatus Polarisedimenticolaceae bacterium]